MRLGTADDWADDWLELGCVAAHGHFSFNAGTGGYSFQQDGKAATAFLFNLISRLQFSGTAPMIDVQAHGSLAIGLTDFPGVICSVLSLPQGRARRGCIARRDRRAFLPILEIDFNRIDQRGLPVRAERVGNVSMLQTEAIISRNGTDRRIAAVQYYVSPVGR
jgi:hypothetical protein